MAEPTHKLIVIGFDEPLKANEFLLAAARLQRQFPTLNDDFTITEVLEESGRRIAAREERKGPLDNLHAYAWVVVRRMAALRLRHDQWAVASATLASAESDMALRRTPAGFATSEQIYNEIAVALLDFMFERPAAKDVLRGRTFVRTLH